MKQLPMTPELEALIKGAVGADVETANLSVFETIALNTKPLPGKRGTFFENATVMPITLAQMVDDINGGNHLPLMVDHSLSGSPKGRFFHAGLHYDEKDGLQMRALFYLDPTEETMIAKLNAGVLDEVSVQFLSTQFNCSDCGWDYFEFGSNKNLDTKTCANGHTIGKNGVHGEMVGLNQFIELSVVARGAADNPKIVGKSEAKLAPESTYRLAARGFEPDALVLTASISTKEDDMDVTALTASYTDEVRKTATLTVEVGQLTTKLSTAETALTAANADVARLTTELSAAVAAKPEGYDETVAERTAALTFLGKQFDHLLVAAGKPKVEGDARPKTVAEFSAKIEELTGGLTSILPTGGKSVAAGGDDDNKENTPRPNASLAFSVRK